MQLQMYLHTDNDDNVNWQVWYSPGNGGLNTFSWRMYTTIPLSSSKFKPFEKHDSDSLVNSIVFSTNWLSTRGKGYISTKGLDFTNTHVKPSESEMFVKLISL